MAYNDEFARFEIAGAPCKVSDDAEPGNVGLRFSANFLLFLFRIVVNRD